MVPLAKVVSTSRQTEKKKRTSGKCYQIANKMKYFFFIKITFKIGGCLLWYSRPAAINPISHTEL
jgi:hypothetical protein